MTFIVFIVLTITFYFFMKQIFSLNIRVQNFSYVNRRAQIICSQSGNKYYIDNVDTIKDMVSLYAREGKFDGINWSNDIVAKCYQQKDGYNLIIESFEAISDDYVF